MRKTVDDYTIEIEFLRLRVDSDRLCHRCAPRKGKPKDRWLTVIFETPWPRGGMTTCCVRVYNKDFSQTIIARASAQCSMSDAFEKSTGDFLAAERAIIKLESMDLAPSVFGKAAFAAIVMLKRYMEELFQRAANQDKKERQQKELRDQRRSAMKAAHGPAVGYIEA